jgi:hypothetical protein
VISSPGVARVEKRSRQQLRVEHPRCPFCHDAVRGEDEKHGCSGCMAWHHLECWRESSERCATCRQEELEVLPDEDEELEVLPEPVAEYPRIAPRVLPVVFAAVWGLLGGLIAFIVAAGFFIGFFGFDLAILGVPFAIAVYYFTAVWVYRRLDRWA